MRAVVINCTLKPSPQPSNTEALAATVITALERHGVEVDVVRAVASHLVHTAGALTALPVPAPPS